MGELKMAYQRGYALAVKEAGWGKDLVRTVGKEISKNPSATRNVAELGRSAGKVHQAFRSPARRALEESAMRKAKREARRALGKKIKKNLDSGDYRALPGMLGI